MNKFINYNKSKIKDYTYLWILSIIFIVSSFLVLYFVIGITNLLIDIKFSLSFIIIFLIGIIMFIISCIEIRKKIIRIKQIKKALNESRIVKATINGAKTDANLNSLLVCSAKIEGIEYHFISAPIQAYDFMYAIHELGIKELPVYVNMQNPKEYYVVDTREIEDRIVDLR